MILLISHHADEHGDAVEQPLEKIGAGYLRMAPTELGGIFIFCSIATLSEARSEGRGKRGGRFPIEGQNHVSAINKKRFVENS